MWIFTESFSRAVFILFLLQNKYAGNIIQFVDGIKALSISRRTVPPLLRFMRSQSSHRVSRVKAGEYVFLRLSSGKVRMAFFFFCRGVQRNLIFRRKRRDFSRQNAKSRESLCFPSPCARPRQLFLTLSRMRPRRPLIFTKRATRAEIRNFPSSRSYAASVGALSFAISFCLKGSRITVNMRWKCVGFDNKVTSPRDIKSISFIRKISRRFACAVSAQSFDYLASGELENNYWGELTSASVILRWKTKQK